MSQSPRTRRSAPSPGAHDPGCVATCYAGPASARRPRSPRQQVPHPDLRHRAPARPRAPFSGPGVDIAVQGTPPTSAVSSPPWPPPWRWPAPSTAAAARPSPASPRWTAARSTWPRPTAAAAGSSAAASPSSTTSRSTAWPTSWPTAPSTRTSSRHRRHPEPAVEVVHRHGPWPLSGTCLYVGGEFTKFGARGTAKAQTRNHIARVSATTGTVDPGWDPDTGNNTTANRCAPSPCRPTATRSTSPVTSPRSAASPGRALAAFVGGAGVRLGAGGRHRRPRWPPPPTVGSTSAQRRPVGRRRERRRDRGHAVAAASVKQLAVGRRRRHRSGSAATSTTSAARPAASWPPSTATARSTPPSTPGPAARPSSRRSPSRRTTPGSTSAAPSTG